jgi:hypothetical protein
MAAPAAASRRAGPVSAHGAASRPAPAALASALPANTNGSSGYASCHDGFAVSGQQHGRVRGERRCQPGGGQPGGPAGSRQEPSYQPGHTMPGKHVRRLGQRRQAGGRTEAGEDPRTHGHRRRRLRDPQHVVEPLGPTQVVDEENVLAPSAASDVSRAARRSPRRPVRSAPAASSEDPAARPPVNRYAAMSWCYTGAFMIGRP